MAEIEKGKISSVSETTASVVYGGARNVVTANLTVPFFLLGCLSVNDSVAFVQFDDGSGLILARMDGDWNKNIDGDVNISGKLTADDVSTYSVSSLDSHTHGGVEPGSSSTYAPD